MNERLRILLAEDDDNDVLLLRRALAKAKLEQPIFIARDGQEVVDYLQGQSPFNNPDQYPLPNLLLLDLKMPKLDGFQVLEWLKGQCELSRNIVVVVFSCSAQNDDLRRACDLGAHFYVVKPHDPRELEHIIERVRDYWRDVSYPGNGHGTDPVRRPGVVPVQV